MNIFRQKHAIQFLHSFAAEGGALDYAMSLYFRAHKAIGSKDRAWISDTLYGLFRWRGLLDYVLERRGIVRTWENRLSLYVQEELDGYIQDASIPAHIQVSFPKDLYARLGENKKVALALNERAPVCVRVNTLKISREALLTRFKQAGYDVRACTNSSSGILFLRKINFFELPEFREGFFEIQDEASQLAAQLVLAKPGDEVLDFCAGAGGKALAIAEKLKGRGQIYLHDIRRGALLQARKRLKRAGIQNSQCIGAWEKEKLVHLEGRMNWVFVDAPCSGTGTLRRNPDMKWKYSDEMLERLVTQQRIIFGEAIRYLSKKGKIVYTTCSLLKEENDEQVTYFLDHYPVVVEGAFFRTIPETNGPDGFFSCVFTVKDT